MARPGNSGSGPAPEVRIDPLNGLRVLVAAARAERPNAMLEPSGQRPIDSESDPFAEGNEAMTPPEVWADRPDGSAADGPGWRVRSVPNLFPVLAQDDGQLTDVVDRLGISPGMPELLVSGPAHGAHEVIVNTARSVGSLSDLSEQELEWALRGWAKRVAAHGDHSAYVHLGVNERIEAGATLEHSHAQLWALEFVPPLIARERERQRAYFEHTQGRRLMEDLLIEEVRGGERVVAIDESAVLIAPFASASPYRLAVVPRKAEPRFDQSDSCGVAMVYAGLAALRRRFGAAPPLNLWLRTAPRDAESFIWRIEIAPRLAQPAAFELGTGTGINSVPPELAAAELREALA